MRYARFELFVLLLGIAVVAGSVALLPKGATDPADVVAQLLVAVALVGAVHWGRNGGFVAAVVAVIVYLTVQMPSLMEAGLTGAFLAEFGLRALTYGLVGIVGGEVSGRVKYLLARASGDPLLDELTGLYSARYASQAISSALDLWRRYQVPCAAIVVTVEPPLFAEIRQDRYETLLRRVASTLRGAVRLVDDVAFAPGGTFVVLLPHTGRSGATVAAERIMRELDTALDEAHRDRLSSEIVSCEDAPERLAALARSLEPTSPEATEEA